MNKISFSCVLLACLANVVVSQTSTNSGGLLGGLMSSITGGAGAQGMIPSGANLNGGQNPLAAGQGMLTSLISSGMAIWTIYTSTIILFTII